MKVTAKKTKQTSMRGWTSINKDTVTGVVVMLPEEEEGKKGQGTNNAWSS